MRKLLSIIGIFLMSHANAFFSFSSSMDGIYKIDAAKTISVNKELGVKIKQKDYVKIISNSKKTKLEIDGDIVTVYEDNEITDGCLLDKQKMEMACKLTTFGFTKDNSHWVLSSPSLYYLVAIKK